MWICMNFVRLCERTRISTIFRVSMHAFTMHIYMWGFNSFPRFHDLAMRCMTASIKHNFIKLSIFLQQINACEQITYHRIWIWIICSWYPLTSAENDWISFLTEYSILMRHFSFSSQFPLRTQHIYPTIRIKYASVNWEVIQHRHSIHIAWLALPTLWAKLVHAYTPQTIKNHFQKVKFSSHRHQSRICTLFNNNRYI